MGGREREGRRGLGPREGSDGDRSRESRRERIGGGGDLEGVERASEGLRRRKAARKWTRGGV